MKMKKIKKNLLTILIPAYNEEKKLDKTLKEIKKVDFKDFGFNKEVILVDDGSTDKTIEIAKKFKWVKVIPHDKNKGKGAAIKTGLENCSGEVFVIQDADLEVLPIETRKMLKAFLEGNEVVFGSRFKNKRKKVEGMKTSFFIGNKILTLLTRVLFGCEITDMEIELVWRAFSANAKQEG